MEVDVTIQVPDGGSYRSIGGLDVSGRAPLVAITTPVAVGEDCWHVSYAEFDFAPVYRTIPIEYTSNTPVRISITTDIDFRNSASQMYAGGMPDETLYVETYIDRLSVRVH